MIHDKILLNTLSTLKESDYSKELIESLKVYLKMNLSDELKVAVQEQICFAEKKLDNPDNKDIIKRVHQRIQSMVLSSPEVTL